MADKAEKKARAAATPGAPGTTEPQKLGGQERQVARAVVAGILAHALITRNSPATDEQCQLEIDRSFELADHFLDKAGI